MTNPQLLDYVHQQLKAGVAKEEVTKILLTQSWSEQDIGEVFSAIDAKPASPIQTPAVQSEPLPINKKKITKWLVMSGLVVVIVASGGGMLYAFQTNSALISWIDKISPWGNTALLNNVYKMYCGDAAPPIIPITVGVDVKTAHYDEIKDAIDAAIQKGETERLGLVYVQLLSLLKGGATTTTLSKDASKQNIYPEGRDFALQSKYLSSKELLGRVTLLGKHFTAFRDGGKYSPSSSYSPVKIDGTDYFLSNKDLLYWGVFYNRGKEPDYAKMSQAEQYTTVLTTLGFLAQVSFLDDLIATSTPAFRQEWLEKISTLSSSSTPIKTLSIELRDRLVDQENIGTVLGILGFREMIEDQNLDQGLPLLQCAAEQYYDDYAMYRLGEVYGWGAQQERYAALLKESPDIGLLDTIPAIFLGTSALPLDNKKSLFWAGTTEVLDSIKHQVFKDASYSFGWNNIARIDTIVNTGVLTKPEMNQIDCEISVFVNKKYPGFLAGNIATSTAACAYDQNSTKTVSSYLHDLRYLLVLRQAGYYQKLKNFSVGNCDKLAGTLFDDDKIIASIGYATGGEVGKATCAATDQEFAVSVPLRESPGNSWCIDNTGFMGKIKGAATGVLCEPTASK